MYSCVSVAGKVVWRERREDTFIVTRGFYTREGEGWTTSKPNEDGASPVALVLFFISREKEKNLIHREIVADGEKARAVCVDAIRQTHPHYNILS